MSVSTQDKIIDAAMAVVREQGVARLTIDEAARAAGVSKGGVLYHFKSKDDLIGAMVTRLIDQCEALQQHHYDQLPAEPNRWAKAALLAAFDPGGPARDPVGGALLAAVTVNRELVRPLDDKAKEWVKRIRSDSPDPELAMLVTLAMDGLWLHDMVGLQPLQEECLQRLKTRALAMLDGKV
jgi:AcrR family transcriptional regulator